MLTAMCHVLIGWWLSRVMFWLVNENNNSFIFHGVDIQSEHDTWQSTSLVNGQCPIVIWGTNIARFYKIGNQNCELNYWRTKSKTKDKLGDRKCNLAYSEWRHYRSFACPHSWAVKKVAPLRVSFPRSWWQKFC